ncbi:MAG: TolC family outer membrane protein [Pseudomonadota bacterium]
MRGSVRKRLWLVAGFAAAVAVALPGASQAETLVQALSRAYEINPSLNAARAEVRAIDEQVSQALAGFRPIISAESQFGTTVTETNPDFGTDSTSSIASLGLSVDQNVFDGFRNVNSTKQAEATVRAARASLANTEQNVLFDAAETFMNVLRDEAIVRLRQQNIEVLSEQLRATQDRFSVGELTRTDVAQAEARLAGARFDLSAAEAQLLTSRALYRQIIGADPNNLVQGQPVVHLLPNTIDQAIGIAIHEHPAIVSASFAEESAAFAVKVAEGSLLPELSLRGSVLAQTEPSANINNSITATIVGVLTIPIYQGGQEYSFVREAKQTRAVRRLEIDVARDEVRAAVLSAWGSLQSAFGSIAAANAQVEAADIALEGVREEARVGQRTTLDVLDAEQELLDARVDLVIAERDKVVASYALLSSIGRLSAPGLGLAVREYVPERNYEAVRDQWFGLRTPSGD